MNTPRSILRGVGSLWFAAVLLVLLLVAMACATVVESASGTERALVEFYHSQWFVLLLGLLGVNVLAAVVVRYPFNRRQIGFVITHVGILVTLGGALVTDYWGVRGQVGFAEGESADRFRVEGEDVLAVTNLQDQTNTSVDLVGRAFRGLRSVDHPGAPVLTSGDLRVEVQRYLPDSRWVWRVLDDSPHAQPAVEVSLSADGRADPTWLFAKGPTTLQTGSRAFRAFYRVAADPAALQRLLNPAPGEPTSIGLVTVELPGRTFGIPLEDCLEQAVTLGDTGYTARVLRYLPHARVEDGQLVNVSDRPVNPTIEVEFVGPAGTEKRYAFAKFPEFESMHRKRRIEGLKLGFVAPELEVIGGPNDELFARFNSEDGPPVIRELSVGVPAETPWEGLVLTVVRRFEQARPVEEIEPIEPRAEARIPALLVRLAGGREASEVWVQKFSPHRVTVDDVPYEMSYRDKTAALGFSLTLNRFHMDHYPGTGRPRSFESHVTIVDPVTGRQQHRIISMNNPVQHAGYSLFQSSYRLAGGQRFSFLSVSRDPGLPIVYTGYVSTMVGMLVILVTRMMDRRRAARPSGSPTQPFSQQKITMSAGGPRQPLTNQRARASTSG